ncbi:efflux RND transporter periplasmic adaptor subunit [Pseudoalteromonas fenneropenaei]|uniref:Efflux RND transporter periplasmic adaptor subunit n=1 Tax=Pseudoalteromonas fenneropenaei TaxID=1737459 RepID=A0ABV7CCC4_9GAMM
MRDTSGQDIKLEPQKRSGRRLLMLGLVAFAAIVGGVYGATKFASIYQAEQSIAVSQLRFATVTRGDLLQDISVQGQVVSANSPTLFSPAEGTVSLLVQAGDVVTRGQLLVEVESPELNSRLAQEQARLAEFNLALERQQIANKEVLLNRKQAIEQGLVNLALQQNNMSRAEASMQHKLISQEAYQVTQSNLDLARLSYEHAQQAYELQKESLAFELKSRQAELERQTVVVAELERQIRALQLTAPLDGIVGVVNIREKDLVTENSPLLTIVDLSHFEISVQIAESYADSLSVGLEAQVNVNGQNYTGLLKAIAPEVNNGQVVGLIRFKQNSPEGLRQNQQVSARIFIQTKNNVLKVRRGQFVESGGARMAYVVEGDQAKRVDVELGARSLSEVEILGGLNEGQKIIISSLDNFSKNTLIHLAE